MPDKSIKNIAAYMFKSMDVESLPLMRARLKRQALHLKLKGTILISAEGINLFLAGVPQAITEYQEILSNEGFDDLVYKDSYSESQPFSRMLVRLKNEIIAFGKESVDPLKHSAEHLSPEKLHEWYQEGKDMIVLDTRNDYEFSMGKFKDAKTFDLQHFRNFPETVDEMPEDWKDKPIVTYCTGGIRCEKAAEWMLQKGFKNVYQLDGGILNYFERCGGDYYDGDCFVFDKRVALDPELQPTTAKLCFSCWQPLQDEEYPVENDECPRCHKSVQGKRIASQKPSERTAK